MTRATAAAAVCFCAHLLQNAHNVLICKNDSAPTGMTAKVTDMGLCCTTKQHARLDIPKTVRSMSHVAPEQQRFGRAGFEADIYSFGIMMWEVFTGQAAYRKLLDAAHLYEVCVCVCARSLMCVCMCVC